MAAIRSTRVLWEWQLFQALLQPAFSSHVNSIIDEKVDKSQEQWRPGRLHVGQCLSRQFSEPLAVTRQLPQVLHDLVPEDVEYRKLNLKEYSHGSPVSKLLLKCNILASHLYTDKHIEQSGHQLAG
ncbi:hypothetical protein E2C01_010869 [Portunus trituberculatus]|uniref:Uncharacterized protein n=1 Tax=Portunus trituberculatus TaxID=210409 RepID=A0A5B7D9J0_PORTR|nr:hypothetical protein [Portunus trituberculatus]